jgi:hypothetical protein
VTYHAPTYPSYQVRILTAKGPEDAQRELEAALYGVPPERIVSITHAEGTAGAFFGSGAPYISIVVVTRRD